MTPIPEWRARVLEEKAQLDEKIENLSAYLKSTEGSEVTAVVGQYLGLLRRQLDEMGAYSNTLAARIELFPQLP